MTRGSELRAARAQAQISLSQMARLTHFTKSYLSLMETGKRAVGPDIMAAYGRVLGSVTSRVPSLDELANTLATSGGCTSRRALGARLSST